MAYLTILYALSLYQALVHSGTTPSNLDSDPTSLPTIEPTIEPTVMPTIEPTLEPTIVPTDPTASPTFGCGESVGGSRSNCKSIFEMKGGRSGTYMIAGCDGDAMPYYTRMEDDKILCYSASRGQWIITDELCGESDTSTTYTWCKRTTKKVINCKRWGFIDRNGVERTDVVAIDECVINAPFKMDDGSSNAVCVHSDEMALNEHHTFVEHDTLTANEKPIYFFESALYMLFDAGNVTNSEWLISSNAVDDEDGDEIFATCGEQNLLDCIEGMWTVNGSVFDERIKVSDGECGTEDAAGTGSKVDSLLIYLLLVIGGILFGAALVAACFWCRLRGKAEFDKTAENMAKNMKSETQCTQMDAAGVSQDGIDTL